MPLNFPELRIASRKSKLALLQAEIANCSFMGSSQSFGIFKNLV